MHHFPIGFDQIVRVTSKNCYAMRDCSDGISCFETFHLLGGGALWEIRKLVEIPHLPALKVHASVDNGCVSSTHNALFFVDQQHISIVSFSTSESILMTNVGNVTTYVLFEDQFWIYDKSLFLLRLKRAYQGIGKWILHRAIGIFTSRLLDALNPC